MSSSGNMSWSLNQYEAEKSAFEAKLDSLNDWSGIPTINSIAMDNMTDGQFARFHGMVQDVLNPEYYFKNYGVKNTDTGNVSTRSGKFLDVLQCKDSEEVEPMEDDSTNQDVRQPLFCIPIPGVNNWAANLSQNSKEPVESQRSTATKRPYPDEDMDVEDEPKRKVQVTADAPSTSGENAVACYKSHKFFPFPDEGGLPCIVKHYGERDDFLVNNRIEAVGFLSLNPALEATWQGSDNEDRATHPPPSLVPRLHAVRIRKMKHCNPSLLVNSDIADAEAIYSDLHTVLTQLLFGDTLAADYLICNILSSVYVRREGLNLGALSLNLYNISVPGYAQLLYKFLESILPCNAYIPLTIDLLNKAPFTPSKDYETNRLLSGCLQLADDTHLIIDETVMTPGQLDAQGLRNVASLHSLALRQELKYDFTYFQLDFHTNVAVLVISEGKSIIPTNVPLKLLPEASTQSTVKETFEAAQFFMSGARLEAVRRYVTHARMLECDMSQTDFVGPAWVELRQQDTKLNQDDLHAFLVLSRIIAISRGRTVVAKSDWDTAISMERDRRARVPS